jgi:photosystem II stability/assembly factor-like uncharacterized protein
MNWLVHDRGSLKVRSLQIVVSYPGSGGNMPNKMFSWVLMGFLFFLSSNNVSARRIEDLNSLAIAGSEGVLLAGTSKGLYESRDEGRTWNKREIRGKVNGNDLMTIIVDPVNPKLVYAGGRDLSVIKSSDAGVYWGEAAKGFPTKQISALAIDPTTPATLHAWAGKHGLYRTKNGAKDWSRVDVGPEPELISLTSVPIPTGMGGIYLYAGTVAGLARSPDCF